jgi:hypothetical protein
MPQLDRKRALELHPFFQSDAVTVRHDKMYGKAGAPSPARRKMPWPAFAANQGKF